MNVTLWGTRGSVASPGPETARYGGNTACVQVTGRDGTLIVLDAGSGIRRLGDRLAGVRRIDLLLSHLHMDHIQGLGFFEPLFRPEVDVHIWGPPSFASDLRERLGRYLSPPLFPVRVRDLPALHFHDAPSDPVMIGGLSVVSALIVHPGPTVGYRIDEGDRSLAYLPDHEPALGVRRFPESPRWTSGFGLVQGVDLLIHDAQYTEAEYAAHIGWGHSSLRHAMDLALLAGVRRLVPFHHDPAHDDSELDRIFASAPKDPRLGIEPGLEGVEIAV